MGTGLGGRGGEQRYKPKKGGTRVLTYPLCSTGGARGFYILQEVRAGELEERMYEDVGQPP